MNREEDRLRRLSRTELVNLHINTLKVVKELKKQLAAYQNAPLNVAKKYNPDWNWMQKIVFALATLGKPSLASEIMGELQRFDDQFDCYDDPLKSFSTFTARAVNKGIITKHRISGFKGCHYALPEWCDEFGKLLSAQKGKISLI
jgi:hypothetical protein